MNRRISPKRNDAAVVLCELLHAGDETSLRGFIDLIFDGVAEEACGRFETDVHTMRQHEQSLKPSFNTAYSHLIVIMNSLDQDQRIKMLDDLAFHYKISRNAQPTPPAPPRDTMNQF